LAVEYFVHTALRPLHTAINRDLESKFVSTTGGTNGGEHRLYVSKNAGAFFSMANGGICISDDAVFYIKNRDHFHLVMTEKSGEEERVVGGALATVETVKERKVVPRRLWNKPEQ
jgi:hypothetical protein